MHKNYINGPNRGFTIVELVTVIVIIGILTGISILGYGSWKKSTITAQLKSDLSGVATAMENYRNFNNTYPASVPTTFKASNGVVLTGGSTDGKKYCVKATNPSDASLSFHIDSYSTGNEAKAGDCTPMTMPITGIAAITGTPQTGQTLTAGAVTPAGATVSYQWQSATTAGGTYTNISGATASSINLNPSNINKYIKVIVTGTGAYSGTQASTTSTQVSADGNWKVVGSQVWATANLNVGTKMGSAGDQHNNALIEKYCYGDTESNCTYDGGLYQWGEAMNYSTVEGSQGICPAGSHIPTDNDWKILEISLGMSQAQADATSWRGTDQGSKLRPGGSSGLDLPFAGSRHIDMSFYGQLSVAHLWTSTESGVDVWYRDLATTQTNVYRNASGKNYGYSVRCLAN